MSEERRSCCEGQKRIAQARDAAQKKRTKAKPVKPQEAWEIGVAALRKQAGFSGGDTWKDIRRRPNQFVGWRAVADWINKEFVRK